MSESSEGKKAIDARKPKSKIRKTFDLKPRKPLKPEDDLNVKLNKESDDDILSMIMGSFSTDAPESTVPKTTMKATKVKHYKPRKIKGKKVSGWSGYLQSEAEVKKVLKKVYGHSKITLEGVIRLFGDYKIKLDERVVLNYDIKEVYKYREYDRKASDYGKRSPKEFKELLNDISKSGIKSHGILQIDRNKNGNMEVLLGEGNHRLAIAKILKIRTMPLRISYYP